MIFENVRFEKKRLQRVRVMEKLDVDNPFESDHLYLDKETFKELVSFSKNILLLFLLFYF